MAGEATLMVRRAGRCPYAPTWQAMQAFTDGRASDTPDELWLLEHPPVFTTGRNAKAEHLLDPGPIPVVPVDRGGQVTYHGPGQVMGYLLLDLRRRGQGVRWLVSGMEQAIIRLLASAGIEAEARSDAPGVYVDGAKVASLGLRVRRGCSYHGLALNVDMDLAPFARINPCGFQDLPVTRLADLGLDWSTGETATRLLEALVSVLGYSGWEEAPAGELAARAHCGPS